MDNQRVFIWAALALVLYLNFMAWQKDYAPAPIAPTQAAQTSSSVTNGTGDASSKTLPDLPSASSSNSGTAPAVAAPAGPEAPSTDAPIIHVTTDVLSIDISTRGGELIRADLLQYPVAKNNPDVV